MLGNLPLLPQFRLRLIDYLYPTNSPTRNRIEEDGRMHRGVANHRPHRSEAQGKPFTLADREAS